MSVACLQVRGGRAARPRSMGRQGILPGAACHGCGSERTAETWVGFEGSRGLGKGVARRQGPRGIRAALQKTLHLGQASLPGAGPGGAHTEHGGWWARLGWCGMAVRRCGWRAGSEIGGESEARRLGGRRTMALAVHTHTAVASAPARACEVGPSAGRRGVVTTNVGGGAPTVAAADMGAGVARVRNSKPVRIDARAMVRRILVEAGTRARGRTTEPPTKATPTRTHTTPTVSKHTLLVRRIGRRGWLTRRPPHQQVTQATPKRQHFLLISTGAPGPIPGQEQAPRARGHERTGWSSSLRASAS